MFVCTVRFADGCRRRKMIPYFRTLFDYDD